jgi:hypothetical protein
MGTVRVILDEYTLSSDGHDPRRNFASRRGKNAPAEAPSKTPVRAHAMPVATPHPHPTLPPMSVNGGRNRNAPAEGQAPDLPGRMPPVPISLEEYDRRSCSRKWA